MLVLFSIAMACFFSLFGMVLILLRQAKLEGAMERGRRRGDLAQSQQNRSISLSKTHAPFGVSQTAVGLTLSNLVPAKQPDWRFMVRENSGKIPAPQDRDRAEATVRIEVAGLGRYRFSKALGDLTDPESPYFARRA